LKTAWRELKNPQAHWHSFFLFINKTSFMEEKSSNQPDSAQTGRSEGSSKQTGGTPLVSDNSSPDGDANEESPRQDDPNVRQANGRNDGGTPDE
jgi:hypothetical protein